MVIYPLYQKAKKLLNSEYQKNFEIVKKSNFHRAFVDEKIKHSLQVSGAGNGILANEAYFKGKSREFIDIVKTAILLHDIYRFREARGWYETGQKIDHSVKGSEFLSGRADFDNVLITLPIKHHGHMIEQMYEDESYLALDDKTKDEVKHIAWAVRDADKIANWYLFQKDWHNIQDIWLSFPHDFSLKQAKIDDILWHYFIQETVAPKDLVKTNADNVMSVICWLFDMNYKYSIFYSQKLNLFAGWKNLLEQCHVNPAQIDTVCKIMKEFVLKKFEIKI